MKKYLKTTIIAATILAVGTICAATVPRFTSGKTIEHTIAKSGITIHYKWDGNSIPHFYYTNMNGEEVSMSYPGVPMKQETEGWYSYTVADAKDLEFRVIVEDVDFQTADITCEAGEYWFDEDRFVKNATDDYLAATAGSQTVKVTVEEANNVITQTMCAMAVKKAENSSESITIHYTSEWNNVQLYAWNALPNDVDFEWPGEKLEKDSDGYYSYTFNGVSKVNFLFSNGAEQSEEYTITKVGEYIYKDGEWVRGQDTPSTDTPSTDAPTPTRSGPVTSPAPFERTDFRDETIYFLMTSRFYDGDSSNNCVSWRDTGTDDNNNNPGNAADDPVWRGDFKGVVEKLDYIKALGFSAIWITPVVKNASDYDYHGYHAINHAEVDVRYESDDCSYQDLINACHEKGIKIVQDIVINHCSDYGEENLFPVYTRTDDISKLDKSTTAMTVTDLGRSIGMSDETTRNEAKRCAALKSDTNDPERIFHHETNIQWEGYTVQTAQLGAHCVDLNTENPTVAEYLKKCYTNYIGMGVDAFRIDTVKHISRLSFNSEYLPAFKQAGGNNFFMFGEACVLRCEVFNDNKPPISVCFYTWKESKDYGWDSSKTLEAALHNESLTEQHYKDNLSTEAQPTSNNAFLEGNEYHTPDRSKSSGMDMIDFYMHHSFESAGQAFDAAKAEDKYFNDSTWNVMYVDSHDYGPNAVSLYQRYTGQQDAWAENLDLIFTFRGIPCIYYGTEIEFMKGAKIDDWQNVLAESGRAYFGEHMEGSVNTTDYAKYSGATGEMANTLNHPLAKHIQRLNQIRRAVPALRKGQYSTDGVSGGLAYKRRYTEGSTDSFVCVTISGDATFSGVPSGTYVDMVTGDKIECNGTLTAKCSGKGNMRVYVLQTAGAPNGKIGEDGTYLK